MREVRKIMAKDRYRRTIKKDVAFAIEKYHVIAQFANTAYIVTKSRLIACVGHAVMAQDAANAQKNR